MKGSKNEQAVSHESRGQGERKGDISTPARTGVCVLVCAAGAEQQEEAGGSQEESEGAMESPAVPQLNILLSHYLSL